MKLLTKDGEIIEGEAISEGLAKFVEDVHSGDTGVVMYSHQKKEIIKYMVSNFELTLKAKALEPVDDLIQPFEYPEPNSLPIVEDPEDEPSF